MKKLFTLLTLALISIGSAWGADETLFSMNVKSTVSAEVSTDATAAELGTPTEYALTSYADFGVAGTSGSFYKTNTQGTNAAKYIGVQSKVYYFTLASSVSKVYYKITLTKAIEIGDVITWTISNKSHGLLFNTSASEEDAVGTNNTSGTDQSYKVKEGDAIVGATTIYIMRATGNTTYYKALTIVRPEKDSASPTIDTDLSTAPVDVDVNIGTTLTIAASHVTGYQWYRNTSASTAGATEISGATEASYVYSAPATDAESKIYFYCVVTNDNATGTKTATSAFVEVNVGAVPTLTAVTKQIWNIADFSDATYTVATIVENLEICNGTIDGGSKNIDGFTLSKRIKINKDADATTRYIKFKIDGPCVITVYGMTGSSSKTRVLGIKVAGTEVATLSHSGSDMGKKTYVYTGADEAEVVLFCKEGDGTFNVHGITVSDIDFTMNAYGWATYVAEDNIVLDEVEGLEAYAITGASSSSIVKSDPLTTIKAGVPVLLKGDANAKYYLPLAGSGAATPSGNLLKAGTGAVVNSTDNAGYNYVLSLDSSNKIQFVKIGSSGATVTADKAYLALTEAPGGGEAHSLFLDDDVTGIKNIKVGSEDNIYYDLQGRRVLYPTKGLYIVNGKKVILK